jgi:type I restriction enzyme S subunit
LNLDQDRSSWKHVNFGEVVEQSKEKVDPLDGTVSRVVAGEHMDTDELKIRSWGSVDDGYLGPAFHRRFRPGQVLYGSRRTYLRKVAVSDFDGVCSNTTFVLSTKDQDLLLPDFLPWVMTSEPFHAFAIAESKGSVNPYVNFSDLAKFEFALPPLEEQKRIADLLWAVEREKRAAAMLQSAVDHSLEAFTVSEFEMPDVPEAELGSLLDMCQYGSSSRAGDTGLFPMLRMTNLLDGKILASDLKFCDLSESEFELYGLRKGDVLFNRTNSAELVGKSGLFDLEGEFVFASYLIRLRPNAGVLLPEFLNAYINSPVGQSRIRVHVSRGVSQANISAAKLRSVRIPIPDLATQKRIVERIAALRGDREQAEARRRAGDVLSSALRASFFPAVRG